MTTDIIDGEIVPTTTALAPTNLFGTDDPLSILEKAQAIATPLAALVRSRGLVLAIGKGEKRREHVQVEGWTLLGAMLGCHPVLEWTRKVTDEQGRWEPPTTHQAEEERSRRDGSTYRTRVTVVDKAGHGGWEARVVMVRRGEVISAGEMECRWEEDKWKASDSYAVRSMAQTRATSKSGRLALSFVMSLAGFEATPAEEVTVRPDDDEPDPEVYVDGAACPSCGSRVVDYSADPDRGNRPTYACSNAKCEGGAPRKGRDGKPTGGRYSWGVYSRADIPGYKATAEEAAAEEPGSPGADLPIREQVIMAVARFTGGDRDAAERIVAATEKDLGIPLADGTPKVKANKVMSAAVRAARLPH